LGEELHGDIGLIMCVEQCCITSDPRATSDPRWVRTYPATGLV